MKFNTPTGTILYSIEQAIKEYRKLCQNNIDKTGLDITVDQALLLIIISDNSKLSQKDMAELLFKDYASITRMIELMVKKDYIKREINEKDRRRFNLIISNKGTKSLKALESTILENRRTALYGLSKNEIIQINSGLQKIITNCKIPNQ
ncbi:MarR family winged helix-turn-helix transcriptional regulator [Aquimarina macrocephali]|uniref:MarR family winged helix-turn-helix transcriptional regulator n=1 Tax=Aquimarina macrocephali TaxID=666563 RepID=UPI0004668BF0|nr:MarR family transcriptional regulator [Aquimarina macrocephali]